MTVTATELTAEQAIMAARIDALDLEPIAYKLMHPRPGPPAMTLAEADRRITAYRHYLKLCSWYPDESAVPSQAADEAWHAHILDTAKYAADSDAVFGRLLHHFPYFGVRGVDDELAWRAASARTRELHAAHFGAEPAAAADCDNGQLCVPQSVECDKGTSAMAGVRPRPDRG
jgi:hypothetical protein